MLPLRAHRGDSMSVMSLAALRPGASTVKAAVLSVTPGVFLTGLIWRSPGLFLEPRIWAEEGHLYLAPMRHLSVLKGLGLVVNGNYQLATNAIVEVARAVPPRDFAVVTTYLSLLVSLAACYMLGRTLVARGLPVLVGVAAAAMMSLVAAGYEVYLNATNVQWTCSLVALLICLSEEVPAGSLTAVLRFGLLAVCGLTGLPSCILAPVFLAGALRRRSAYGWVLVAVIAAASCVQLGIVLAHRGEIARPFNLTWMTTAALSLHAAFGPFLPAVSVDGLGVSMGDPIHASQLAMQGGLVLALVGLVAWESLGPGLTLGLIGAAVWASLVNEVGALDSIAGLMSGVGGGRYFFLAGCCVAILLAAGLASPVRAMRAIAGVMVALILCNGVLEAREAGWTRMFLTGPSHAAQVDACRPGAACTVREWPLHANLWVTVDGPQGSPSGDHPSSP